MKKETIIFIIIIALFAQIIFFYIFFTNQNTNPDIEKKYTPNEDYPSSSKQTTPESAPSDSEIIENQTKYENNDIIQSNEPKNSESSSSSENPVVSNPPEGPTCFEKQIPYSSTQTKTQECYEYSGEICIDKKQFCKVLVKNQDETTAGDFTIQLKMKTDTEIIENQTKTIHPKKSETFEISTEYAQDIECNYETIKIPTKEICY